MHTRLSILLFAFLLGCSTGVETETDPPEYQPREFQVQLFFSSFAVTGDCDGDLPFITNPGELATKFSVATERLDGSFPVPFAIRQSLNYGSNEGEKQEVETGESYTLEGLETTITVQDSLAYRLYFNATEWDGNNADDRMDDRSSYHHQIAGTEGIWTSDIPVGIEDDCKLRLDVSGIEREIVDGVVVGI